MQRSVRRSEAGFSLVTAVIIITLLVFLGTMVLSQVASDVQLAGGDRAAMNAMYIAEAGAVLGKDTLVNDIFPGGTLGTPTIANISSLTQLPVVYPQICPDGINCSAFYALAGYPTPYPYNNGTYTVAVSCSPSCTGTPSFYTIRSYGATPDGAARLVEVTVGY